MASSAGALGFFALPYTIILCPLLFVLLWSVVVGRGRARLVQAQRHGSPLEDRGPLEDSGPVDDGVRDSVLANGR